MPLARLLLALTALLAAAPGRAAPAQPYTVGPAPDWVDPLSPAEPPSGAAEDGGVRYLLVDDQVRLVAPFEHHRHVALRVQTTAGVEDASEVRIDFDPSYQRLVLHGAWIVRGGRRLPVLRAGDVRVIQREPDLDHQLVDGTSTAVLFLPDVRRGDLVEYAYTLRGANPVLAGRYADAFPLAWGVPVDRVRVRVLAPPGRALHHRLERLELSPRVARRGPLTELTWERRDVAAVQEEDRLPPGLDPAPALELSEFASWEEVVRWALPLYPDAPLTPAMQAQLATWRRLPAEAERARAALRFVEDEVRYLGLEEGEASHRPHAPGVVFARRFGDCKDKAYLLVTLLRALGLQAAPALVDTEGQESIARRLPSPYQFDHVIVRARIDGQVRWLEPTRSLERAPIAALVPPPYGLALPIAPGVTALEPLPARAESTASAVTTLRVARYGAPATLEVVTTLDGLRALAMRQLLAGDGKEERQRSALQRYAQLFPGLAQDGPLQVEDAPERDRVILRERYRVPAVAAGTEQDFTADLVRSALEPPDTTIRTLPLQVEHPVALHEELRIELPDRIDEDPDQRQVATPAARLSRRIRVEGSRLVAEYDYRSLRAEVGPAELAQHLAGLRTMRQLSGFTVTLAGPADRAAAAEPAGGPEPAAAGLALGVLAVVALALVLPGRQRR